MSSREGGGAGGDVEDVSSPNNRRGKLPASGAAATAAASTTPRPATTVTKKLTPNLPSSEIAVYTAAWIVGVTYAVYNVYLCSRRLHPRLHHQDLELSWLGGSVYRKDVSDTEWHVFSEIILGSLPWLGLHFLGAQLLRSKSNNQASFRMRSKEKKGGKNIPASHNLWSVCSSIPQLLPTFVFLLGFIFMSKTIGLLGSVYLCLQPVVFFVATVVTRSSMLCYAISLSLMLAKELGPLGTLHHYVLPVDEDYYPAYIASVCFAWINSRCLSFCLDMIWGEVSPSQSAFKNFVNLLAYTFYLPLSIMGPLVNYKEFYNGVSFYYIILYIEALLFIVCLWYSVFISLSLLQLASDHVPLDRARLWLLSSTLCRYLFWLGVNHLVLHVLYFNAIHYDLDVLGEVDLWSICGIAFAMGQFFHMKYVVYYGIPRAFLMSDNVELPAATKCVSRIHLYSDMWRYFDNGLYKFIHK